MELVSLSDYIFLILKILLVIGLIEAIFLVSYRLKNGVPYFFVKKIPRRALLKKSEMAGTKRRVSLSLENL